MDKREFKKCIHPGELPRFILACFVVIPLAILFLVLAVMSFGIALIYVLIIAAIAWVAFRVFFAFFIGNSILVTEENFPRIKRLLDESRESIGIKKDIHVFIFGEWTAFAAFRFMFTRYAIFLGSGLLERDVNDQELRWIIGRFVGRVRAKRRLGIFSWLIGIVERIAFFNLFLLPYERSTVYSGDRIALADIDGDISTAVEAMNKLYVGNKVGYAINPHGIVKQRRELRGSLFSLLARIFAFHPHMTDRYVDLIAFARREYPEEYARFLESNPSFPALDAK